jgi:flavodoxin
MISFALPYPSTAFVSLSRLLLILFEYKRHKEVMVMSKTLILYFSKTGTTKRVAEAVASRLNADIYSIEEEDTYSHQDLDWTLASSRANKEQKDSKCRPAYKGKLPDLSGYHTVIIGHPIWWGIPPRILYTVLEDLDLSHKKVAAFATSGGSTYSVSQDEIKNIIGPQDIEGRVLSGQNAVDKWLTESGLL